jgi:hypothetical protein
MMLMTCLDFEDAIKESNKTATGDSGKERLFAGVL